MDLMKLMTLMEVREELLTEKMFKRLEKATNNNKLLKIFCFNSESYIDVISKRNDKLIIRIICKTYEDKLRLAKLLHAKISSYPNLGRKPSYDSILREIKMKRFTSDRIKYIIEYEDNYAIYFTDRHNYCETQRINPDIDEDKIVINNEGRLIHICMYKRHLVGVLNEWFNVVLSKVVVKDKKSHSSSENDNFYDDDDFYYDK